MAIQPEDHLAAYNAALFHLGERQLSSLTEAREPRRVLDSLWRSGKFVVECLEQADWNFAYRAIQMEADTSTETSFGFKYVYEKPDDFVRLAALSADQYFRRPLTSDHYADGGQHWLSDRSTLYVRYVSKDDTKGMDSTLWTEGFRNYVEARLAMRAAVRITNSRTDLSDVNSIMMECLKHAKEIDGNQDGPKMLPQGSWSSARGHSLYRSSSGRYR